MSDSVIKFPLNDRDDAEHIYVEYSANSEQLIHFCAMRLLRIEASLHALSICLGNDLTMLLSEAQREPIDSAEFVDTYRQVRRAGLKALAEEFSSEFPPRKNN